MLTKRESGILMPLSSLPGGYGIGSLGAPARRFVDFLVRAGQAVLHLARPVVLRQRVPRRAGAYCAPPVRARPRACEPPLTDAAAPCSPCRSIGPFALVNAQTALILRERPLCLRTLGAADAPIPDCARLRARARRILLGVSVSIDQQEDRFTWLTL